MKDQLSGAISTKVTSSLLVTLVKGTLSCECC